MNTFRFLFIGCIVFLVSFVLQAFWLHPKHYTPLVGAFISLGVYGFLSALFGAIIDDNIK